MHDQLPYRVIGALDTETTNIDDGFGVTGAFVSLYQLGTTEAELTDITPENVRELVPVELYREYEGVKRRLMAVGMQALGRYVPVIAVHNLSFDMHPLSTIIGEWNETHGTRMLAKSPQKPITIALKNGGKPFLVFWDTLGFSGMGLEKMGASCGFEKGTGEWDYSRVRAPQTALEPIEEDYAKRDIWALMAWLGWYLRRTPEVSADELGFRVTTKTGAVRAKRRALIEPLRGKGMKKTVGRYWHEANQSEKMADDDFLFTVQACTRGGFVFCASENAGKAYKDVYAFDAASQHPAQMVSHRYPVGFSEASREMLDLDAELVSRVTPDQVVNAWDKPFPVAFCACFEFTGLRPKLGTVYEENGVYPLAWARFHTVSGDERDAEADGMRRDMGYCDTVEGSCSHAFGKLERAERCRLYLTELGYWEVCQAYDWDGCFAVHGYETARFSKPTDFSVLSVLEFYQRKNRIKQVRKAYYSGDFAEASKLAEDCLPDYLVREIADGEDVERDLEEFYMGSKADLNGLFGIEATNEAKRDLVLTEDGIQYTGLEGAGNLPKMTKAWYQFGQRIVGWSRVAQHIVLQGLSRCCEDVINGDTDSIKVSGIDRERAKSFLESYGNALDRAKTRVMERVRRCFPSRYDELKGIGHYELESVYPRFYSAWNKSYCARDNEGRYHITLAGVPTDRRNADNGSLEDVCADLERQGMTFQQVCGCVLGYNATYSPKITKLNMRTLPKWASRFEGTVTDWRGDTWSVSAPRAIGIAPMAKTVGGFSNSDNRENAKRTARNNSHLMIEPHTLSWKDGRAWLLQR